MKNNKLLLQEWVLNIDAFEQAKVISALRGCDDEIDDFKYITRSIRYLVVNNITNTNKYCDDTVVSVDKVISILKKACKYNSHWYYHIKDAIWVLSKLHPNNYVNSYFKDIYTKIHNSTDEKLPKYLCRLYREKCDLENRKLKLEIHASNNKLTKVEEEQLSLMTRYYEIVSETYTTSLSKQIGKLYN